VIKIQQGFLYLADLNPRIGTEPGKIRPILVIQTDFLYEANHPSTWILPCTTKIIGENILRVLLEKGVAGNNEKCEIMIDQSRTIDNSRFKKLIGKIPKSIMNEVKDKIKKLADL